MVGHADLRVSGFVEGGLSEAALSKIVGPAARPDAAPAGGLTELRIVGILPGFGPVAGTGRTAVIPIDVARHAFATAGANHVDLALAPGSTSAVTSRLASTMTEPYVLAAPADIARNLRA